MGRNVHEARMNDRKSWWYERKFALHRAESARNRFFRPGCSLDQLLPRQLRAVAFPWGARSYRLPCSRWCLALWNSTDPYLCRVGPRLGFPSQLRLHRAHRLCNNPRRLQLADAGLNS